jgi:DNA-binding response OmpR family regulator
MVTTCPERILLVEDEEDVAFVLKTRLERQGYDVHIEAFGSTALSYATEHRPDLVILDLKLPDLDGYAVCQELRRLYSRDDVQVLMFTGLDEPSHELRGRATGADAYLTKRVQPAELFSTVTRLLSQRPGPPLALA